MIKSGRINILLLGTLLVAGGIWHTGMAAEADPVLQLTDACSTCHSSAPVPATHVPVASASVTGCLTCHNAEPGDKLLIKVHDNHLTMGMPCGTCHAGTPPPRTALDALLKASGVK